MQSGDVLAKRSLMENVRFPGIPAIAVWTRQIRPVPFRIWDLFTDYYFFDVYIYLLTYRKKNHLHLKSFIGS